MYHRTRRASFLPRGALRSDAAPTVEYCRASPFAALSPEPSALSLRNGRVQDGLGVVRASALDSGAVRARGDGPSGWNAGRNCVLGAGGMERRPCGQTFMLVVQPLLFDDSRAPATKHTLWAYCHVPNGSGFDMTDRVEAQIERFAPGFRNLVIARSVMTPRDLERHNTNLVGGDINGGAAILEQMFF